MKKRKTGT